VRKPFIAFQLIVCGHLQMMLEHRLAVAIFIMQHLVPHK